MQQWRPGVHLHIAHGHYLADFSGERGDNLHLHLHRFQHSQSISDCDCVARFHGDGNDDRRRRRVDDASIITVDAVRHAVDLDAISQPLGYGDDVESAAESGEPVFELTQTVDVGQDAQSINVDAILLRAETISRSPIGMSAIAQFGASAYLSTHQRPPTQG